MTKPPSLSDIEEAKIETAPPASADTLSLIEQARADEAALTLDSGEASIVKVIRPPKSRFFRAHPEHMYPCGIIDHETTDGIRTPYLLLPKLFPEFQGDYAPKRLFLCVAEGGGFHFWPVSANESSWSKSALAVIRLARDEWIRAVPDRGANEYGIIRSAAERPEPSWPDKTLTELVGMAFPADQIITGMDHPIARTLKGYAPNGVA